MLIPKPLLRASGRALLAAFDPARPVLVQMVIIRRCNLSCGYCNEYDDVSPPVDTEVLLRRIDHVARLGTPIVTLTGGEPLLHPDLDRLIAHVVSRGMVCTSISNAYPITARWIERLNQSRLTMLQVSIDNGIYKQRVKMNGEQHDVAESLGPRNAGSLVDKTRRGMNGEDHPSARVIPQGNRYAASDAMG